MISIPDGRPPPLPVVDLDPAAWLTIAQAAAVWAVSRRTVYNWMEKAVIEYVRTPGGGRRIRASSLLKPGRP